MIWGYWYTVLLLGLLISGQFGLLDTYTYSGSWSEAPLYIKVVIPIVLISMFGFFALMLADFFSEKDVKYPVLVGFTLLLLNWLAILVYFWVVVYRREKSNQAL